MRKFLAQLQSGLILVAAMVTAAVLAFFLQRGGRKPESAVTASDTDGFIEPAAVLRAAAQQRNDSPIDVSRQFLANIPQWPSKDLRRLHRRLQLEGNPGYALAQAVMATELGRMTMDRGWQWDTALAYTDPDAAWALAWSTGPDYRLSEWLGSVLKAIRNTHGAETALKYLETIDDPDLRHSLAQEVVMAAPEENPDLAASLCEKYPEWRSLIRARALQGLAKSNPRKALESVNGLPSSERLWATDAVLVQWLRSDADAARAWIEAQSDVVFHPDGHALGALAATDPVAALGLAQQTGTRTERLALLTRIMRDALTANEESGEAVATWMGENLNATEIAEAVSGAANFSSVDPPRWQRELAASALERMEKATGTDRISRMVREWGDFDAKRAWVEALPDVSRRKMSGVLLPEWSARDSREAADFLRKIPTAEGRALVLRTGIEAVQGTEAFVRWADSVTVGDASTRAMVPELQKLDAEGTR